MDTIPVDEVHETGRKVQHINVADEMDCMVSMDGAKRMLHHCPHQQPDLLPDQNIFRVQMYAEIEPNFNQQFFDQLPATWCLVDENANMHEVDYNKSLQYPLITNGWEALRHFYGMTENHMVYLGYMGDDLFKLRVVSKPSEPASFPKFHSCWPRRPRPSFIHPLSNLNVIASYLDLPQELATHLRNAEYENMLLFGPTGAQTDCKVLIRDGNKKSTKIGKGWKTFCTEHNLKSGDVLRFVFVNPEGNNAVKVEKV